MDKHSLLGAIEAMIDAERFPALALAVYQRGDLLLHHAWGWIDPEAATVPASTATLFDLASLTKLFTVSAFLSLVSEGRVSLDDPLVAVIPEFGQHSPRPIDGGQDPHTKVRLPTPETLQNRSVDPAAVRFLHLLTHTSGLAPWRDVFNVAGAAPSAPVRLAERASRWAAAQQALMSYPFVGEVGSRVRYSDLGLMLLGAAIERLAGADLAEVIRSRVTAPLGLDSITFNPLAAGLPQTLIAPTEQDSDWRGRRCWGEVHDENACGLGGVAGHAGLFGTAQDVARFGEAWRSRDPRLGIDPGLMATALQQQAESEGERRGLGWMLHSLENSAAGDALSRDTYGHTGFTGTSLFIDPHCGLVVALLTNRVYPGRHVPGIHALRRGVHQLLGERLCTSLV